MSKKFQGLIVEVANYLFPDFYRFQQDGDPGYFFKNIDNLPQATSVHLTFKEHNFNQASEQEILLSEISDKDEIVYTYSKIEGSLILLTAKNKEYIVRFGCYADNIDAICLLGGRYPRNIAHFAKTFLEFFFYVFLSDLGVRPDQWENLRSTPELIEKLKQLLRKQRLPW